MGARQRDKAHHVEVVMVGRGGGLVLADNDGARLGSNLPKEREA
jgi:hypothetical protein